MTNRKEASLYPSYLTRIFLNRNLRSARYLLSSPQRMHAAVLACFPPDSLPANSRPLWRLDSSKGRDALYIVSPLKPDARHIVEQAGWLNSTEPYETKNYSRFLESLKQNQAWHFRLTANPTRYLPPKSSNGNAGEKPTFKRHGHITVEQQIQWLVSKSDKCGFTVPSTGSDIEGDAEVTVVDRGVKSFKGSTQKRIKIAVATFEGKLIVRDTDLMAHSLTHGIGHAKAFGCGLMTLAPLINKN